MAFSLTKLVTLAAKLDMDFGVGPCIGFDAVLAMAYMSGKEDEFNRLLDTIGDYKNMDLLASDINAAKLRTAVSRGKTGDKLLVSIYEFLVSIAKINLLQSQTFQFSFAYQEYQKNKLIFSNYLQDLGGLKSKEENLILQLDEVKAIFLSLRRFAKKNQSICFCIESHDHDVFLRYNTSYSRHLHVMP